jgi:hypothetical protein
MRTRTLIRGLAGLSIAAALVAEPRQALARETPITYWCTFDGIGGQMFMKHPLMFRCDDFDGNGYPFCFSCQHVCVNVDNFEDNYYAPKDIYTSCKYSPTEWVFDCPSAVWYECDQDPFEEQWGGGGD